MRAKYFGVIVGAVLLAEIQAGAEQPNIVFFFSDDHADSWGEFVSGRDSQCRGVNRVDLVGPHRGEIEFLRRERLQTQ